MIVILLISTLSCLLVWIYLRWTKVRSYWADRRVPHELPHPIWGSLTFLQKKNAGIWMKEMYSRFSSPYVGIWLFWRPALIVNCPEIGKRILVKDSDVFRDRFLGSGKNDPIGGLNIFTSNDPLWTSMRKRLTPVFTSSKLRSLHGLLSAKSKQLEQRIRSDVKAGDTINLRMVYSDFTTDVIGISSFGVDSNATSKGESHMRTVTKDFMTYNFWRGLAWSCIFFFPELVDVFGFTMFPKKATDYFKKVFHSIEEQRRTEGSDKRDLMDALLKIKLEAEDTNEGITEDAIIAQAAIFLQGGFDTSGSALTFTTYELAFHPEVQDKLYHEIVELKQRIGNKDFHFDDLVNLTYMTCVINETLRKYPPMGFLDRIAAKDYKIDENLTIPAGTPVYVNAIGMHVDPKYFPEPEKFNPDRFLPENEEDIQPNTYLPFGEGPRVCIGMRFANYTMRYALASIILNFELRPLPDAPKPKDVEIEKMGIFYMPSGVMSVEFVPRN
ncbi:cytochrome P450 6k1 [Amyelois transitella]|uniref:cytochrome P450 6k1 n=1 Tax=Amyelois transitella TaxID=680683 RepID=UPI00067BCFDA|nr:cytochrome P450 6k1 [Amyelois transitella]XP_060804638.1 cytochrome P450 6k1 [Amyelois transitella]XP_060804639.1 cytochrome P450 6k1 [Amyelois transitella]XP_060804640.1 cytochrome P450 6k1 [Amyelois transitella]